MLQQEVMHCEGTLGMHRPYRSHLESGARQNSPSPNGSLHWIAPATHTLEDTACVPLVKRDEGPPEPAAFQEG